MASCDITLVQMPWAHPGRPSIPLGLVKAALAKEGLPATCAYLNLDFFDFLARATALSRESILEALPHFGKTGLSAWTFAVFPLLEPSRAAAAEAWFESSSQQLRASAPRRPVSKWLEAARQIREVVPSFLEEAAAALLRGRPKVVGFTTSLDQLVPTLVMAKLLKQQDPCLKIVLGGAECRAGIAQALCRWFPWIDAVLPGEGEANGPALFRELLAGDAPGPVRAPGTVAMSEVPLPDFDEYFERLAASGGTVQPVLLYQTSRGCWWGEHSQCLFCSRDEASLVYRRQSSRRMTDDLRALATRHGLNRLELVDDNLDPDTVSAALAALRAEGLELSVVWGQSHPTLSKAQLQALRLAGVTSLFVGLETLSTPILRSIRKGTSALSSVRFLRWCAEVGINVRWNFLYGMPGESAQEYVRMAEQMASLSHLPPPYRPARMDVRRFSPYFDAPEKYGIEIKAPAARYRHLAACIGGEAFELASSFEFEVRGQGDPDAYAAPVVEAYERWLRARAQGSSLTLQHASGGIRIEDRRDPRECVVHLLEGAEAALYLRCEAGASRAELGQSMGPAHPGEAQLDLALGALLERRLVLEDEGRYLALATFRSTR